MSRLRLVKALSDKLEPKPDTGQSWGKRIQRTPSERNGSSYGSLRSRRP